MAALNVINSRQIHFFGAWRKNFLGLLLFTLSSHQSLHRSLVVIILLVSVLH